MDMERHRRPCAGYRATHFRYEASADGRVATITLDRPERKNPLSFDSYAELRDLFRALVYASDVRAVVVTGAGGNFSSGGLLDYLAAQRSILGAPGAPRGSCRSITHVLRRAGDGALDFAMSDRLVGSRGL